MYLIIPLTLFSFSVIGIAIIFLVKFSMFRKMSEESRLSLIESSVGDSIFSDLFPELSAALGKIKLKEHKDMWLSGTEKFLRKLRVLSLRVDRASGTLIQKIREVNSEPTVKLPAPEIAPAPAVSQSQDDKKAEKNSDMGQMKKEEQKLILEIAKNPKDAKLYVALGELYVQMGDFPDAKESYDAAVELDSSNEELKQRRSKIMEMMV